MRKVKWGVLGAARIALKKVIPAMQAGEWSEIAAIASRDRAKAQAAAAELSIPTAYGSYEELIEDPEIEAIYNPLPNHLHIPWSIRAIEAGKHVLCEKPVALDLASLSELMRARDRKGVQVGEAFMVHSHPQWLRARELVQSGEIGSLVAFSGVFSFFNRDAANVRNVPEYGGGALLDIGCYPIHTSRFIFGEEPLRVCGTMQMDPDFGVDRLTSGVLEYASGHAVFTCSTQQAPYQRIQILGAKGRIEIEIPFNAPPDRPCVLRIDNGADVFGGGIRTEHIPVCDQYTLQGDDFSRAIRTGSTLPVSLENSWGNTAAIEAVVRSARSGEWIRPERLAIPTRG